METPTPTPEPEAGEAPVQAAIPLHVLLESKTDEELEKLRIGLETQYLEAAARANHLSAFHGAVNTELLSRTPEGRRKLHLAAMKAHRAPRRVASRKGRGS